MQSLINSEKRHILQVQVSTTCGSFTFKLKKNEMIRFLKIKDYLFSTDLIFVSQVY